MDGHHCCRRSRRMALGADGVDRPELLSLSWPLTAGGVSVLWSEAGANTGMRAGDIGRISGWNGSARASFTAKSVTGTADVDGSVGLRTDVENGLKVGVVRRCCFCCCSWTMRSAGRRAGDGCGVDSRSRNFTNSSENDWWQTTTANQLIILSHNIVIYFSLPSIMDESEDWH